MSNLPELEKECFFIAPIGEAETSIRRRSDGVLKYIVGRAAEEVGLTAIRADQLADPGQINLQVVEHVLNAKVAVADLTGLNPNVFYEIAIRHTARLPLVLIAEKDCVLPFDISNMRTIFFDHTDLESADHCRESIVTALKSTLNGGAVESPIATSIDLSSMSGGNVVERGIADILSTLEELSREQRQEIDILRRSQHRYSMNPIAVLDLMEAMERLESLASICDIKDLEVAVKDLQRPMNHLLRRSGVMSGNRIHEMRNKTSSEDASRKKIRQSPMPPSDSNHASGNDDDSI